MKTSTRFTTGLLILGATILLLFIKKNLASDINNNTADNKSEEKANSTEIDYEFEDFSESFSNSSEESLSSEEVGNFTDTVDYLLDTTNDNRSIDYELKKRNVRQAEDNCPFKSIDKPCDPSEKFRRLDGSCNNLAKPYFGKVGTPYRRLLRADYDDDIGTPRNSGFDGSPLPNPRLVTLQLSKDNQISDKLRTHLIALFGQFLDHDIIASSIATDESGASPRCDCASANKPLCISIPTPKEDLLNVNTKQKCMIATRSGATTDPNCNISYREQLNHASTSIDLSTVYSTHEFFEGQLRLKSPTQKGLLKTLSRSNLKPYLPGAPVGVCAEDSADKPCFQAGDGRVNENLGLTSIHTIFLREHNRIANALAAINPQWNDERVYQEARRINIAEMQHIVYAEFVPLLVGSELQKSRDLLPLNSGFFKGYSRSQNLAIYNEFAAAAYRLHTIVRSFFKKSQPDGRASNLSLAEITFRPVEAWKEASGGIDGILKGSIEEGMQAFDRSISEALLNHLFEVNFEGIPTQRFDIAAITINRGRDHGLRPYNYYRKLSGQDLALNFSDLNNFDKDAIDMLSKLYKNVNDIDLYIGGINEKPVADAITGQTFAFIISRQFRDLKFGDRFFYESDAGPNPFTAKQLDNIRRIKFSRLFCDNVENINSIQPLVFLLPDNASNKLVSCSSLPSLDFNLWKE